MGLPRDWYDVGRWGQQDPELQEAAVAAIAAAGREGTLAAAAGAGSSGSGAAVAAVAPVGDPEQLRQLAGRLAVMLGLEAAAAASE